MQGDKIETQDMARQMQQLEVNGPVTHIQVCAKCGLVGKRRGMIYLNMPKESIGKRYRITYELVD